MFAGSVLNFFLCTKLLMLTLTIEKDKDIHTLHAENVTQGNCCSRKKSHKILRYLCDNFFAQLFIFARRFMYDSFLVLFFSAKFSFSLGQLQQRKLSSEE